MSRLAYVYVGPFAMWPEECAPSPDQAAKICGSALGEYPGGVVEPGAAPRAGPAQVIFYVPNSYEPPRPGGPSRTLHYCNEPPGECVGADYRSLDREAEVEAFRTAYARELAALAKAAGREPVVGWGVIYGYS
jgi:hypothetical protein